MGLPSHPASTPTAGPQCGLATTHQQAQIKPRGKLRSYWRTLPPAIGQIFVKTRETFPEAH
jgi:hypothetical protein